MGAHYHSYAGLVGYPASDIDGGGLPASSLVTALSHADDSFVVNSPTQATLTSAGQQILVTGTGLSGHFASLSWTTLTAISGFGSDITVLGGVPAGTNSPSNLYSAVMGPNATHFVNVDTGDIADSLVFGEQGGNQLLGGEGNDYFEGAGGADQMSGGRGDDTFRLYYGDFIAGEIIDGDTTTQGGTRDTIEVKLATNPGSTADVDLSQGQVTGIEILRYIPNVLSNAWIGNHVTIGGNMAFAGTGGQALAIWGSVSTDDHTTAVAVDSLTIRNDNQNGLTDFSTLAFTAWQDGIDIVNIISAQNVTGTIKDDLIDLRTATAGGLAAKGSDGNDVFIVGASLANLSLEGGNGSDTLKTQGANVYVNDPNFFGGGAIPTVISVERLVYDTGNSTVTDNAVDIARGAFHFVTGSAGNDTLVINAAAATNVDLSSLVFTSWDDALDKVQINGSSNNDVLTGSSQADTIQGFTGNDFLSGGLGSNTLIGGAGDDTYVVVSLGDTVIENSNEGNDLLYAGVSGFTLPANVETLWLTGTATSGFGNTALGNTLVGNGTQDSSITGGANGDVMIGAHTSAKTTMVGGGGDDVYVTFNSADVVQENGGGGNDTVYAAVDFAQPVNVETLWLVGSATHGTGSDNGGTLVANNNVSSTVTGGAAADLLVGAHDVTSTLAGGGGNDTYVVFNSGDTVQEQPNGGNDIVYSTADFTLPANVETLWLIGGATHATSNAGGGTLVANNNLNSILTGGSGSDLLVGGHSSTTTMAGGQDSDTYVSFVGGDVVQEAANGGNDTLVTYLSQTIPGNVETMVLAEGAGAINGTGGADIDTIIGNAFDNVLDGGGNLNVLVGGGGADTFVFKAGEVANDIVTDFTSGQDHLEFIGYGAGTLTQLDATHWQINSANGLIHDTVALTNAPSIQPSDLLFV